MVGVFRGSLITLAALLAACSEPLQFDQRAFDSEYTACFKASGRNYSARGAKAFALLVRAFFYSHFCASVRR